MRKRYTGELSLKKAVEKNEPKRTVYFERPRREYRSSGGNANEEIGGPYIFANVLAVAPSAAMPAIPLDQRMPDYSLALFAYGYQY